MRTGQVRPEFWGIHHQPGPEAFLAEMGRLQYRLPDLMRVFYLAITRRLYRSFGRPVEILDIGSSYGINPAIMSYGFSMDELTSYFLERDRSPDDYAEARDFFKARGKADAALRFHLVDENESAGRFSVLMNLCDDAFTLDIESNANSVVSAESPEARFWRTVARADLFISTGRIGYLTEEAFERIFHIRREMTSREVDSLPGLQRAPRPLFAFSLVRHFDVRRLETVFSRYGFELIPAALQPIPERRFESETEKTRVIQQLRELNADTTLEEHTGFLHTRLFFAGPATDSPKVHNLLHEAEEEFRAAFPRT